MISNFHLEEECYIHSESNRLKQTMILVTKCIRMQVSELRAEIGPLSGRSLQLCTDACLRRYLVARNWNVVKAKKMLQETLKWRAAYKPEEIRWVCQLDHINSNIYAFEFDVYIQIFTAIN